jgi:general stress protein 26
MHELKVVAPAFVAMAHSIVWCSVATVDAQGRPRMRILHPYWEWDGERLVGWIGTSQSPVKAEHLATNPYVSCSYWNDMHDTCSADAKTEWCTDEVTLTRIWNAFKSAPAPLGYDPAMIPAWTNPTDGCWSVLRLEPWRLRVFPGTVLLSGGTVGEAQVWQSSPPATGRL